MSTSILRRRTIWVIGILPVFCLSLARLCL